MSSLLSTPEREMFFLSVIPPDNATENEYLKATTQEIKNTYFLPECLPAT
jgi:hypothetical protein